MRKKNESIHLFILDEDRKKSARELAKEKVLREWLHAGEQPISPPQYLNDIDETVVQPSKAKASWLERMCTQACQNPKIGLGIPTAVVACSLISIIALLRLDAAYELQSSLEWATPYWIAIRITMGMLWLMIIDAVAFQMYVLRHQNVVKGTMETGKRMLSPMVLSQSKAAAKGV